MQSNFEMLIGNERDLCLVCLFLALIYLMYRGILMVKMGRVLDYPLLPFSESDVSNIYNVIAL